MENTNQMNSQIALPNSTTVLVLGILSIVCCFCWGIVGLVLGIIAISLSKKAKIMYNNDSNLYTQSSFSNLKAGRTCAIIGTCLSGLYMLYLIVILALYGTMFAYAMDQSGSSFPF